MKRDVFIARVARGAAATAFAGAWILPDNRAATMACPAPPQEAACVEVTALPNGTTISSANNSVVITLARTPSDWTKKMEREFRSLALSEAKGNLIDEQTGRLNELTRWRNQLLQAPTSEETLRQLRRDRLLARMEELLKEYVEFQEGAGQERASA